MRTAARAAWRRRGRRGAARRGLSDAARPVRVRFAPSPTGSLHLGGLRTALFNSLVARQAAGGAMILRVEDTDRSRLVPGSAEALAGLLRWAGVEFDEGPGEIGGGPHGPYTQSERLPVYHRHAERLLEEGHAYRCFCPSERLEGLREVQLRRGLPTVYDRLCDRLPASEAERRAAAGEPHVVRLRIPDGQTVLRDLVKGVVRFPHRTVDDQVLLKSDGFPTYHLASVVDDALMRISHVIRGDEWLPSTVKHLVLYKALDYEPPEFAHLPLLLDEKRNKLSKRHGHASVERYVEDGYLPEAVANFVALLGWNPGGTQEVFTPDELVERFSLGRVQHHAAAVDVRRLEWLNSEHLKRLVDQPDTARLESLLLPLLAEAYPDAEPGRVAGEYAVRVARALRDKVRRTADIVEFGRPFFCDEVDLDAAPAEAFRGRAWRGAESAGVCERLADALERGEAGEDAAAWFAAWAKAEAKREGVGAGRVMSPVRYLLTAHSVGPGVGAVVGLLGAGRAAERLRRGLAHEAARV